MTNCKDSLTPISRTRMPELEDIVSRLCAPASCEAVLHRTLHDAPMPSLDDLNELMSRLRSALFPGYFGSARVEVESMRYHMAANLDSIYRILAEQIRRGGCFTCADYATDCAGCETSSREMAMAFMQTLPRIRELLVSDVKAAYEGDPAAKTPGETIFCYPSIQVMTNQRVAHQLYRIGVPLIPRILCETAHSLTGIDIHPGASIGEEFFIDHGTGVVIGETCVIGKGCRLYQGVTLGALSFPKEPDGTLTKGIARHPVLEDNVTVYAGATILGRVTIGEGAIIGGNVWVTHDVEPGCRLVLPRGTDAANGSLRPRCV